MPPYTFKKILSASDVGNQSRLLLQRSDAENHILSHLSEENNRAIQAGQGVRIRVCDRNSNTEHELVLKRMVNTTGSYVLNGGWIREFVNRRGWEEGQEIGLFWNIDNNRLDIYMLPPPPDQNNPN
ncbi:unnamed protein product [Eruca vesicaria subsp. sativa]|uniref:TF-B3 domain-containing protein n=1 Tax=Eruca vesicaria subsp. sativa TaxID=29727 RepID=A0ABC8JEB7_ERUVS|nr:unnamed protein product [Eruca vesicaria subsp. sativa]